jgi:hypothetical protein
MGVGFKFISWDRSIKELLFDSNSDDDILDDNSALLESVVRWNEWEMRMEEIKKEKTLTKKKKKKK